MALHDAVWEVTRAFLGLALDWVAIPNTGTRATLTDQPLTSLEQSYRILNMGSILSSVDQGGSIDDRTTRARIRDAAIECFAEYGVSATTAAFVRHVTNTSPR
jgi:hypothetical protein